MNRHRQGPAKELPTSLFRAPRNRLPPTLLRCRLELTAVSAICLLGLAIWFSKTEPLVAVATVCYRSASQLHPIQPRGPHSLFRGGFSVKRPLPLRFTASPRLDSTSRRGALFLPFSRRGAEPTSFPPPVSTRFVDSLLPTVSTLSPVRLSPFRGAALLPPPRWVSTILAPPSIPPHHPSTDGTHTAVQIRRSKGHHI